MIERSRYRRKVFADLLGHPATVLPAVAGMTALLASWAGVIDSPWWPFWGIAGLLAGAGIMASRWIFGSEKILHRAFDSLQEDALKDEKKLLDQLDRRLRQDNDPRPEEALRQLRQLYEGFRGDRGWQDALPERSTLEIGNKVEKLFKACIITLSRSQDLWETSQKMATANGRQSALAQREELVKEIRESVRQLARTIDGVQSLQVQLRQDDNLAQIRQELDESLEVARRVEQRMQNLEAELSKPSSERE
ncbi:MAG: hypothetical protein AB7O62_14930 [Pirellulales bacterium]